MKKPQRQTLKSTELNNTAAQTIPDPTVLSKNNTNIADIPLSTINLATASMPLIPSVEDFGITSKSKKPRTKSTPKKETTVTRTQTTNTSNNEINLSSSTTIDKIKDTNKDTTKDATKNATKGTTKNPAEKNSKDLEKSSSKKITKLTDSSKPKNKVIDKVTPTNRKLLTRRKVKRKFFYDEKNYRWIFLLCRTYQKFIRTF